MEAGDPSAEPVVLLHGSCTNSAFWFNEIMALMPRYHVFAVDIIGEAGNSVEYRRIEKRGVLSLWLKETLEQRGAKNVILCGNSLGSWLALNYAVRYPNNVKELLLFAPAGLSKLNDVYLEKAEEAEENDESLAMADDAGMPQVIVDFINLILSGFNPISEELPQYSGEEVERLKMPLLMVAGVETKCLTRPAPRSSLETCSTSGDTFAGTYWAHDSKRVCVYTAVSREAELTQLERQLKVN